MKKIIIIGAGPAGLTAAYEALKRNKKGKKYDVIVLEAENQVGGLSKTINYDGNRIDIGGHRFFSKNEDINNFWKELLPLQGEKSYDDKILKRKAKIAENGPDPENNDRVMLIRRRISRILYLNKFFDYPISLKFQTLKNMGFKRTSQIVFSYLKTLFVKKEKNSLKNFYINRFGKKLYNIFFEKYTEKLWGRHPKNISADWGSQRVKGLSIKEVIKNMFSKKSQETSLIDEFWYPKYGPGQLFDCLAEKVENMGGKILRNHNVINININKSNKIKSVICNNNGKSKEIDGDVFISSMPIKDLVNSINKEMVSEKLVKIANGLPYRDFMTVGLLVNNLNLKNTTEIKTFNNIVPDCWIYVQEPEVKLGRIQIFNNWSPYMLKDAKNTVWIGLEYFCSEGDRYWNMSDEEFISFAIDELIKIKVLENKGNVIDSCRIKVKKAYPAYFDAYSEIDKLKEYLNSISNLYCIGRNGQHRYNNMDHSMLTAMITIKNIDENNKDKSNIWNVNTEKTYQE